MKKYLFIVLLLNIIITQALLTQTTEQGQWLKQFSEERAIQWQHERAYAESLAKVLNIPIRQENPDGSVIELQRFENGLPMYYKTDNINAAKTVSTDKVWPGASGGFSLTGSTDTLGIWDGGKVRDTHQELTARVILGDGATTLSAHATHVSGTMIASGAVASAKGMSYEGRLRAYYWDNDQSEMATAAAAGLRTSNHSYGYIRGWYYNYFGDNRWAWFGDVSVSTTKDYYFGFYDSEAQDWDNIARNAPYYLIVKSAGNDRLEGPATQPVQHWVWVSGGWTLQTVSRDRDGAPSGYDCISNAGVAKNILTIGAVDDIVNGYSQPSDVVMSSFSCWGPTDDGRIKPDIVANGVGLYSSVSGSNSSYGTYSGTSMSSPNVTGSLGLLLQYRKIIAGNNPMRSSTLKGLVIHTADEAGSNPGPDYIFGWGLMNTLKAAQVMRLDSAQGMNKNIRELTLSQGQTIDIPVYSDGTQPLRTTICWTDPAGTPVSPPSLNPPNIMLVNDIDLRVIRGSTTYSPWILNPSNPPAAATTGDNIRDNVEQVHLATPAAGFYLVRVSHKGTLSGGSQVVSLILSGIVPTATLSIQNVQQTAPNKLQFTIYLKNTGYLRFGYRTGEYNFNFNKNILGSGSGSMSIISSDLPTTFRPINPSVVTSTTPGQLRWQANLGSDGGPVINPGDSIKIMTVELTSTENFQIETLDLEWRTTESPVTSLTRYQLGNTGAGSNLVITNYENSGGNPLLPVQILSFIATFVDHNSVRLEWETISEVNNYGFYVQKLDPITNLFATIEESFQPGAGTSNQPRTYYWNDENPIETNLQYQLKQVDNDGLVNYFGPIMLNPNLIKQTDIVPTVFKLNQNYPNPFNPNTTISFNVTNSGHTTLKVYNLLGNEIKTLFSGNAEAGKRYEIEFDASNLTSGIYFYKLSSNGNIQVRKMTLMK